MSQPAGPRNGRRGRGGEGREREGEEGEGEVVRGSEKERKGDGRDALYRGVMDASRGWFRLGLAATSVKVIVIGGTAEREIYSACRFTSSPFFFSFRAVVSATVLYTDNWWNGLMHFFFLGKVGEIYLFRIAFSSLPLKYIFGSRNLFV